MAGDRHVPRPPWKRSSWDVPYRLLQDAIIVTLQYHDGYANSGYIHPSNKEAVREDSRGGRGFPVRQARRMGLHRTLAARGDRPLHECGESMVRPFHHRCFLRWRVRMQDLVEAPVLIGLKNHSVGINQRNVTQAHKGDEQAEVLDKLKEHPGNT